MRAAQAIAADNAAIVAAGGMENMSMAPYLLEKARIGYRLGNGLLVDSLMRDGLWCAFGNYHIGMTAEALAKRYAISRQEQDGFAAESQQKCAQAMREEKFKEEIVPVPISRPRKPPLQFETDEFPKPDTTTHQLATLPPAFVKNGTVTAGNTSGINDGAAAVVVASQTICRELGLTPMAEIVACATAGVEPDLMGIAPVFSTRRALDRAGISLAAVDLIELNEAFAAQSIAVMRALRLPAHKVNVNGGAIALGHPFGASGARILVTLIYEMQRRNVEYGLATLCMGGGQGISMIVKRSPVAYN